MQEDRINKQRIQYINNRQSCTEVTSDKTVGSNQCDNHHVVNCVIDQAAVSERAANETKTGGGRVWLSGFQPREKVEQVRNCAALPRDFVDVVVLTVARLLLNAAQKKPWDHTLDVRLNTWNKGGKIVLYMQCTLHTTVLATKTYSFAAVSTYHEKYCNAISYGKYTE